MAVLLLLLVSSLSFAMQPIQSTPASHAEVPFFSFYQSFLSFDQIVCSQYVCPLSVVLQVHIVYLGHNDGLSPSLTSRFHLQLMSRVFTKPEEAREAILYSYSYGFSGFAALLNSTQAATLSETAEVISVFRSRMLQLHTTRSWDFMGLSLHMQMEKSSQMHLKFGDDVIVGVLDTDASLDDDPQNCSREMSSLDMEARMITMILACPAKI
ncbi:hypothetical protein EJB05_07948 [Eragrostis curvula]|uniref:Inhibitor I9 domain-containing protein n=1 Tax=Eragrostis curvula TaxID=38414 RepID=A0A5J9WK22_9POAL|nr:hypothetical protein EJB05_07948 [Eragrostis curvula]